MAPYTNDMSQSATGAPVNARAHCTDCNPLYFSRKNLPPSNIDFYINKINTSKLWLQGLGHLMLQLCNYISGYIFGKYLTYRVSNRLRVLGLEGI